MHASPAPTIDLSAVLLQSNDGGGGAPSAAPSAGSAAEIARTEVPSEIPAEVTAPISDGIPEDVLPGEILPGEILPTELLVVLGIAAVALGAVIRFGWWRLPGRELGRRPADPVIWLLAASVVYLSGSLGIAAGGLSDDPAYARLSVAVLGNLLQCALATAYVLHLSRPAAAPAHPIGRALLAGVVGFAILTPLTMATSIAVNELLVLAGLPRAPKASHETLAILVERRDALLTTLTLAHVAVLVPVAEELLWRGMIQPAFRAIAGARTAIAATAVLFVLIHWSAIAPDGRAAGLSMIAVLAVGLGILRERTGSVIAPIAVHALFNAANVAIALAEKPVSSTP